MPRTCSGVFTVVSITPLPSGALPWNYTPGMPDRSGGVFTATIPAQSYGWSTGIKPISVVNGSGTSLASMSVTVCTHNASHCP